MVRTIYERDNLLNHIQSQVATLRIGNGTGTHDENSTALFNEVISKTPTKAVDGNTFVAYTMIGGTEAVGNWTEIGLFDGSGNLLFVQNISFTHNAGDKVIVKYIVEV